MIIIQIINKGIRAQIRFIRNLILILFSFALLLFAIIEVFSFCENIQYVLIYILLTLLSLSVIMSGFLIFKKCIGQLIIDKDKHIVFRNEAGSSNLNSVVIRLNSDVRTLQRAREEEKSLKEIFNYGNYLYSESLPKEQKKWELLLTSDSKHKVLNLASPNIRIEPLYVERPLIYESPLSIVYRIVDVLQPFS